MSKRPGGKNVTEVQKVPAEYRFDYSKAKPNPYAARLGRDTVTVVLDPDVAAVFSSSESVNTFLRSVIAVLPAHPKRRSTKRAGQHPPGAGVPRLRLRRMLGKHEKGNS